MRLIKPSITLLSVFITLHTARTEAQLQARQGAPSGQRLDQTEEAPSPPIGGALRAAGIDVPLGGTNEPAIAVNPLNPLNIVASSLFSYRVSNDGGNTWTGAISNVVPAGYFQSGDPALAFDSQGRLFYTYLGFFSATGGLDTIVSELNPTTGALIAGPVLVSTSGPAGGENDKAWIAVDHFVGSPFQDRLYLVWTEFPTAGSTRILFAFSSNHGATWSSPVQLSVPAEGFPWPAHIAAAPNGDVYVSYHSQTVFTGGEIGGNPPGTNGQVFVLRSTNGGISFPQKSLAFTHGQAGITFNVQSSPGTIPNTDFWLQGSGQAWILPDPLTPGNVYVVANDDPDNMHGSGDDADVFIARSTDNGFSWSSPTRVDHGPGTTFQVMPTAAIDDSSGCIVVMWYDNRLGGFNGNGNYLLDVFYTVSVDGGLTFGADVQFNDVPFDPDLGAPQRLPGPPPTLRIGEYIGVAFVGANISGVWTGNTGFGQQMVFDTALGICGDATPPSPDPMEWEPGGEPAAISSSQITMTAALATDTQNSVEYCLMGVSGPGVGSLCWQAARTFTDTGLTANTIYSYETIARDTAIPANETLPSSPALSGTTFIESPSTFFVGTVTDTSIGLTAFNPAGLFSNLTVGSSGLFFEVTPPGGVNANVWVQVQFVDVTGLTPGTEHTVRVKARNQFGVETPFTASQFISTTGGCTLVGDVNQDGLINGEDIDGYLRAKLGQPPALGEDPLCADFGNEGDLALDTAAFVSALLLN